MAYDEGLAEKVRDMLALHGDVTERKMFGGIAWMLQGNMACGVLDDELIVRVGPEAAESVLEEPHVRPFDFTGKISKGMAVVMPEGIADPADLAGWVEAGVAFASSLPPK